MGQNGPSAGFFVLHCALPPFLARLAADLEPSGSESMFIHLQAKNYGIAGALSVFLFIISAILCWFVFKMNIDSDPDGA